MRIDLRDVNGYQHTIDTKDTELIAKWFTSWMPEMMQSAVMHYPWQIQVWPSDETESAYVKGPYMSEFVNSERMFVLADVFRQAAESMQRTERRNSSGNG